MLTFFSCKKIAKLISDSQDRELPWQSRMVMKMHLFVCKYCSRFRKQIRLFEEIMHESHIDQAHQDLRLTSEARTRIQKVVKQQSEIN